MKSKLETIFKRDSAIEIEIDKLDCNDIYDVDDLNGVRKLRKKLTSNGILIFLAALFTDSILIYVLYDEITSGNILSLEALFFIVFLISMTTFAFFYAKRFIKLIKTPYTKAQYGIVHDKFSMLKPSSSSNSRNYYVNVYFPEKNTLLKKAECINRKSFDLLEKDAPVLVVSFDNCTAYIVEKSTT